MYHMSTMDSGRRPGASPTTDVTHCPTVIESTHKNIPSTIAVKVNVLVTFVSNDALQSLFAQLIGVFT